MTLPATLDFYELLSAMTLTRLSLNLRVSQSLKVGTRPFTDLRRIVILITCGCDRPYEKL